MCLGGHLGQAPADAAEGRNITPLPRKLRSGIDGEGVLRVHLVDEVAEVVHIRCREINEVLTAICLFVKIEDVNEFNNCISLCIRNISSKCILYY